MNIWLLIALMPLVPYLPRYLPMGFAGKARFPELIERGALQLQDILPKLDAHLANSTRLAGDNLSFADLQTLGRQSRAIWFALLSSRRDKMALRWSRLRIALSRSGPALE